MGHLRRTREIRQDRRLVRTQRPLVGPVTRLAVLAAGRHRDQNYITTRITADGRDAIVDIRTGQVVTNDYSQITLDLSTEWRAQHRSGAPDLYPEDRRAEIDEVDAVVFADVNNGVYRCGFAGTQAAYEAAYHRLFDRLDWLSARLNRQRYLVGDTITEADVRLFTTPGFGDTIDFDHIKRHYYQVHRDINPSGIVPVGPDLAGWLSPHSRDSLVGRPFGDGTPPGPPSPTETVPREHTPRAA